MLDYFLENTFINHLFELFAALAGSIYLFRKTRVRRINRYFVYFLWANLFIDLAGFYTTYAYFTGYESFSFIENTPFERNYWWYNSYKILSYLVYFVYFLMHLAPGKRKILGVLVGVFGITSILNLIFSGVFFYAYSAYTDITGTLVLLLTLAAYYYELLSSDKVLNFHLNLAFYVSVGILMFRLVVTPLSIYSSYFTMESPDFVAIYSQIMKSINIFTYSCFTIGFLVCSQKKNSY